jgi:hypothetical protein
MKEIHEKNWVQLISGPRFEPRASWVRSMSSNHAVRSQILTTASMKTWAFWDVAPYSLTAVDQHRPDDEGSMHFWNVKEIAGPTTPQGCHLLTTRPHRTPLGLSTVQFLDMVAGLRGREVRWVVWGERKSDYVLSEGSTDKVQTTRYGL